MPIYEYRCKDCDEVTEFRSSMAAREEMAAALHCESCGSVNFSPVYSAFSVTGPSQKNPAPSPPSMGGCAGGSCHGGMCRL